MTSSFRTFLACGLFVLSSAATYAAPGDVPSPQPRHIVHRHTDFGKARAQAPLMIPVLAPKLREPETDGLSRNDEDCNYGCIDH